MERLVSDPLAVGLFILGTIGWCGYLYYLWKDRNKS